MASVISFSPTSGTPGTSISIVGTGFLNAGAVKFGSSDGSTGGYTASFTVVDDSNITAIVPTGGGSGYVSVFGTAGLGAHTGFTFIAPTTPPVFSADVSASTPSDGVVTLTFTDTTTGITGLVSKILVITDCNGVVVDTINMGSSTTATYDIESDLYLVFTETIIDGSGTTIGVVKYLSTAFYDFIYPPLIAGIDCENDSYGQIFNLSRAELYKSAAITDGEFDLGVSANALIIQANFYLNTPYYA